MSERNIHPDWIAAWQLAGEETPTRPLRMKILMSLLGWSFADLNRQAAQFISIHNARDGALAAFGAALDAAKERADG